MRKDIEIHINTGDITLNSTNKVVIRDFRWVEESDKEQRYLYGEIVVPGNVIEDSILNNGIYVDIPYTPIYKEFKLKIKRQFNEEDFQYLRNPKDGTDWFLVQSAIYGQGLREVYASELMAISEGRFLVTFNEGNIELYSGYESDVTVIKANWQNRNLLLKCVPGNNFRYPLTGVGLIRWTNSNINVTKLAQILKEQFAEDGTPVISAKYDFDNKRLLMNLDTSNVDKDGNI